MSDPQGDEAAREPHETETIPEEDIEASDGRLQPDTQGDDPEDAWLGEDGQGDLAPEDEPRHDEDDGPDDLRVQVEDLP